MCLYLQSENNCLKKRNVSWGNCFQETDGICIKISLGFSTFKTAYRGIHEKGSLAYLCALGIERQSPLKECTLQVPSIWNLNETLTCDLTGLVPCKFCMRTHSGSCGGLQTGSRLHHNPRTQMFHMCQRLSWKSTCMEFL